MPWSPSRSSVGSAPASSSIRVNSGSPAIPAAPYSATCSHSPLMYDAFGSAPAASRWRTTSRIPGARSGSPRSRREKQAYRIGSQPFGPVGSLTAAGLAARRRETSSTSPVAHAHARSWRASAGSASSSARARRRSSDIAESISAAARAEASSVTASTWNFSRGHERNPYSRASASCASAIDGNSPALRRRLASSRRWRRSGRDGRERGSDMSAPLGLRLVRTPGRESRPSPVASHSHHSWACGPFRGPGASCTHSVTIPNDARLKGV